MPSSSSGIETVARSREKSDQETIDLPRLEHEEALEANDITIISHGEHQEDITFKPVSKRKKYIAFSILGIVLLTTSAAYADRLSSGDSIARGVSVSGVDVGNMSSEKATNKLQVEIDKAINTSMQFVLGDNSISISSQDLELSYDAKNSVDRALDVNRSLNPASVIPSFFDRTFTSSDIEVSNKYNKDKYDEIVQIIVNELSTGRVDASVEIDGTNVTVLEAQTGTGVSTEQVQNALTKLVTSFERSPQELKLEDVEAQITLEEAQTKAAMLEKMFSQDSTLTTPGGNSIVISKELLASAIKISPQNRELKIEVDKNILRKELTEELAAIEIAPKDASFAINGNSVSVVPEVAGKQIDFDDALKNWMAGKHNFQIKVMDVKPTRDSQWAKNLNITEQVSTYTGNFPAGQARVTNIKRAAEVVNGTIVEPGQTFSLNDKLGPRTEAAGYVRAPAFSVSDGFYDDFGGGVSQFSTTLFNAYYFGGYKDITHKPHTIYISRYPMGREATLNYGSVDLKFQNDSKSGVLIRTSTTATSVTVTLYGNKEGRKVSTEGPNIISQTPYETQYVDDPALPAGVEKQLEAGYPGIVVENYRTIERPGQEPKRERFRWTYRMIPKKIARGTQQPTSTVAPDQNVEATG